MNEKQSLVYSLYAQSQLMIETLDNLEGTKFSSKKERNLLKRVQEHNLYRIDQLHKDLDEDQQISVNDMVEATETTIDAIKHKGVRIYIALMKALKNGEIKFED
jgi:hypothetical protein